MQISRTKRDNVFIESVAKLPTWVLGLEKKKGLTVLFHQMKTRPIHS